MGGPEYARFVGIRSLEPVGVYLPGDKNYPVGRRQWRSSPPNHLFHESGAPRRTSIVHQPGSNHLISYTTLLDHLCFQAVHDCAVVAVVASNLPKVCSSISTVRSCISAAWSSHLPSCLYSLPISSGGSAVRPARVVGRRRGVRVAARG